MIRNNQSPEVKIMTDEQSQSSTPPRMPAWVKWSIAIVAVLIVVLVVSALLGVRHGPGMHS